MVTFILILVLSLAGALVAGVVELCSYGWVVGFLVSLCHPTTGVPPF